MTARGGGGGGSRLFACFKRGFAPGSSTEWCPPTGPGPLTSVAAGEGTLAWWGGGGSGQRRLLWWEGCAGWRGGAAARGWAGLGCAGLVVVRGSWAGCERGRSASNGTGPERHLRLGRGAGERSGATPGDVGAFGAGWLNSLPGRQWAAQQVRWAASALAWRKLGLPAGPQTLPGWGWVGARARRRVGSRRFLFLRWPFCPGLLLVTQTWPFGVLATILATGACRWHALHFPCPPGRMVEAGCSGYFQGPLMIKWAGIDGLVLGEGGWQEPAF